MEEYLFKQMDKGYEITTLNNIKFKNMIKLCIQWK